MSELNLNQSSLVELSAAENTFQVPAVETVAVSTNDPTVRLGNRVEVDQVFDRDTLLTQAYISSTDSAFINLLGHFDPFWTYLDDDLIKKYTSPFGQVNFGMIITVRIIAPGSCYGAYCVQALCDGGRESGFGEEMDGASYDAYPNSTQDVHAFLNVELKNDIVFELPWEHFLDAYNLEKVASGHAEGPGCWRLLLWALAPISNTISNTPANGVIQIYGRMGPIRQFDNLKYQGKGKKKTLNQERYPSSKDIQLAEKPSQYLAKAGTGVNIMGGAFPIIAPWTTPIATGLSAASKVLDLFGFTRESAQEQPTPLISRLTSSMANVDGTDTSEMVALSTSNSTTMGSSVGGGEELDPLSIADLYERWTIVDVIKIDETSTDIVRTIPVTPYIYEQILGVKYYTTGGFVGFPFSAWRGGMEYCIYIPSSPNIQGTLQVLWSPDRTPPTFISDPTNRLTNVLIDLKGTSRTCISVGYSQPEPSTQATHLTSNEIGPCNGQLIFNINAPVTAPRVTGFDISVIVMARPAKDMRFGIPTTEVERVTGTYKSLSQLAYQSGGDDSEQPSPSDDFVCLSESKEYDTKSVLFGEEFLSLRSLVQKFSPVYALGATYGPPYSVGMPHIMPPPRNLTTVTYWTPDPSGTLDVPFTYYGYYLAAFTGVRGSSRLKIISELERTVAAYPNPPGLETNENPIFQKKLYASLYDIQSTENRNGMEWAFPWYNRIKYWPMRYTADAAFPGSYARFNKFCELDNLAIGGCNYYAGAPDTAVTRFRRIPAIIF